MQPFVLRAIPAQLSFLTGPGGAGAAGHLALPTVLGHVPQVARGPVSLRAEGLRADDLQQIRRKFLGVPVVFEGHAVGRVRKAHVARRGGRSIHGTVDLFDHERALGERLEGERCCAAVAWLECDVFRSDAVQRTRGVRFNDAIVPRGVRCLEILPKAKRRPYLVLDRKTYELLRVP